MPLALETKAALAARYAVSRHVIQKWMRAGMPIRRIGRLIRLNPAEVDPWIVHYEEEARARRQEEAAEQRRLQQLTGGLHAVR